jgi:hypothetical protein
MTITYKDKSSRLNLQFTYETPNVVSSGIPQRPEQRRRVGILAKHVAKKSACRKMVIKPKTPSKGIVSPSRLVAKRSGNIEKLPIYLRIYRKSVSNLKNRETILSTISSAYEVGPTLIWTENPDDLAIFTTNETYTHFIGFEAPFNNPRSPKYLAKILSSASMRMKKGSILIKETSIDTTRILVHFCAYRIDETGTLFIFDPSWHSADPGIYSTTAFYDSLDSFGISYRHVEVKRTHHWQSILPFDDYCQTWTLRWLMDDPSINGGFPLPKTEKDARKQMLSYILQFTQILLTTIDVYMSNLPTYKLEGNDPMIVFKTIIERPQIVMKML